MRYPAAPHRGRTAVDSKGPAPARTRLAPRRVRGVHCRARRLRQRCRRKAMHRTPGNCSGTASPWPPPPSRPVRPTSPAASTSPSRSATPTLRSRCSGSGTRHCTAASSAPPGPSSCGPPNGPAIGRRCDRKRVSQRAGRRSRRAGSQRPGEFSSSARGPARGTPAEPWVANGLGVVASLRSRLPGGRHSFPGGPRAFVREPPDYREPRAECCSRRGGSTTRPGCTRPVTRPGGWMTTAGPSPASSRNPARGPPTMPRRHSGRAAQRRSRTSPPSPSRPFRPPGPGRQRPPSEDSDRSPPAVLVLSLGQSRRLHVDVDATAISIASPEDRRRAAPLAERALRHR